MKKVMLILAAFVLLAGLWGLAGTEAKAEIVIDVTNPAAGTAAAIPNDGQDDQPAIQAALDTAKTAGDHVTVKVPAGNYDIGIALLIYSNTTLELDDGATISNINGTHLMLVNRATDLNDNAHGGYTRSKDITIKGGTWDAKADGSAAVNIMLIAHAENVTVSGVTMKHCCGNHFLELNSVKNGKVTGCTFRDFVKKSGLDYDSDDGQAGITPVTEALQLDFAGSGGAEGGDDPADKTPCTGITVSGNTFENVMSGVGNHHKGDPGSGYTISGNTFRNVHKNCVNLFFFEKGDITVTGNTAENVRQFAAANPGSGTESAKIKIENNTATGGSYPGYRNGVFILNPGGYNNPAYFIIKGNTFTGFENGIHLNSCDHFEIDGNTISKSESCAIRVHGTTDCSITGNTATECGDYNIGIFNGCSGKVEGNSYDKSYGIWIVNSDGMTRGANTYIGHDQEANYTTVYYHRTDDAEASDKVTEIKVGEKKNLISVKNLGFIEPGSMFVGWKVYREETKEWRVWNGKDKPIWAKAEDIPAGYTYALFEDEESVKANSTPGEVRRLYGQWQAGDNEAVVDGVKYKLSTDLKAEAVGPEDKNVKKIEIPDKFTVNGRTYTVTSIADQAFEKCPKLTTVTLGKNIAQIGKFAFRNSKKVVSFTVKTTKLTKDNIGKDAFKGLNKKVVFKCPKKKLKAYEKLFKEKGAPKTAKYTK